MIGVVLGLAIFATSDRYTIYDIDFTGGYKLQADFRTPTTPDEVGRLMATTKKEVEVEITEFEEGSNQRVTRKEKIVMGPYPGAQVLAAGTEGRSVEVKVQRLFADTSRDEKALAAGLQPVHARDPR